MYYRLHFDIQTGKLNGSKYGNPKKHIDMLFGDYLLVWLEEIKMTVEATTYAGYKNNIQYIIAPYFNRKNIRLRTVNAYIIEEFYREQLKRISANTILKYHANIRKALSDATKDGLIGDNPAKKVHKPKANHHVANYYTKEELKTLFKVAKGSKIEFPVLMAGCYGLRREEIVGLQWSAIDFANKTITIRHTVVQCMVDGSYQILKRDWGKTKKSIRMLPLISLIEKVLLEMRKREEEDRAFFGENYCSDYENYIYKETNGKIVKPDNITRNFARLLKTHHKLLRKICFRDLRHSCATILRHEGVYMEDIQKWLGHSQITTTEQIYAHFEYETHIKSAQKLQEALKR